MKAHLVWCRRCDEWLTHCHYTTGEPAVWGHPVCYTSAPPTRFEVAQPEVERLVEVARNGITAPSGVRICSCHNVNAVKAGMERACWACEIGAALSAILDAQRKP